MNESQFYQTVTQKAAEFNINPILLLSGIEGLYTFKDVQLSRINYDFLDSLILTIFALRIGDQFHGLAEEQIQSGTPAQKVAAVLELQEVEPQQIKNSDNFYLQSFAKILDGKSPIRNYHIKALEVAAVEIRKAQLTYSNNSIGDIVMEICKTDTNNSLGLSALFA